MASPQPGEIWVDEGHPAWSEWRLVRVVAVDLLGDVTVLSHRDKRHVYPAVEFARRRRVPDRGNA